MPLHTYAAFTAAARTVTLPPEVLHHAKRCLVDWFAATLPGGVLAPATMMAEALAGDIDRGGATLFPSGRRATDRTAALINGSAAHTVEFDDIYRDGIYHPGAPVIAAALACAEAEDVSGELLLRGIVSGYEVSNRIAQTVNPAHYEYWHTTATVGFFGTAAACATILGLTPAQAAHALGTVGTFAAGLQQAFRADAMSKPLHSGRAAEGGLLGARMAKAGVTGALDILDGERGFGNAMCRSPDWTHAADGLGSDWTITRMTQKNHAACGHVHAAVDAVIDLAREHGLTLANVRRIRVGSYAKSKEICGNANPTTAFEAKFSMPYCLAAALVTGRVRVAAFEPAALADPAIREVIGRIEHTVDDGCQAAFPKARSARVAIETTDGRVFDRFSPTRKGDPDAPLTDAELNDKYDELAAPVLGGPAAARLLERLWSIETAPRLSASGLSGISLAAAAE